MFAKFVRSQFARAKKWLELVRDQVTVGQIRPCAISRARGWGGTEVWRVKLAAGCRACCHVSSLAFSTTAVGCRQLKQRSTILQQGKQPSLRGCRPYSVLHRALLLQGPELLSGADEFRSSGALKYRCIRAASNNVAAISGARHPGNRYRPSTIRLPF